jgi:(1->4)-alpha-D-glucan 1-alpha-D-glucosylmutase
MNRRHRGVVTPLAEYFVYQAILGAWPAELLSGELDTGTLAAFTERIVAYTIKAGREAKLRTSWTNPDGEYERALEDFVRAILDPHRSPAFLESLARGARSLAATGMTNGLAQAVLKATAPGVPDTYQGTELWDLSLVDPDNRRPVDFAARAAALAAIDAALANGTPREALARELLAGWHDGRIKLYVLATLLRLRAAAGWPDDAYAPLEATGDRADHVVAYARGETIVIVPRLVRTLSGETPPLGDAWGDTALVVDSIRPTRYRDALTDRIVSLEARSGRPSLELARVFAILPVAVFQPVE